MMAIDLGLVKWFNEIALFCLGECGVLPIKWILQGVEGCYSIQLGQ